MLRVTIELVPFGDESKAKKIKEMVIANDTTGDWVTANYEAIIAPDDYTEKEEKHVVLKGFKRELGAWELVKRILESDNFEGEKSDLYKRLKERLK